MAVAGYSHCWLFSGPSCGPPCGRGRPPLALLVRLAGQPAAAAAGWFVLRAGLWHDRWTTDVGSYAQAGRKEGMREERTDEWAAQDGEQQAGVPSGVARGWQAVFLRID